MNISIYTALLDISLFQFTREILRYAKALSDESVVMDPIAMEIDAEGEQQMTLG